MKRVIDISEPIYKSILAIENEEVCCMQNYVLINIVKNSEPYDETHKISEARKVIWDTSLTDACKIIELRKLIDYE